MELFKEIPSREIIKNDIFEAHKLSKSTIEEIYKTYLEWFNYTSQKGKRKRSLKVTIKRSRRNPMNHSLRKSLVYARCQPSGVIGWRRLL